MLSLSSCDRLPHTPTCSFSPPFTPIHLLQAVCLPDWSPFVEEPSGTGFSLLHIVNDWVGGGYAEFGRNNIHPHTHPYTLYKAFSQQVIYVTAYTYKYKGQTCILYKAFSQGASCIHVRLHLPFTNQPPDQSTKEILNPDPSCGRKVPVRHPDLRHQIPDLDAHESHAVGGAGI